VKPDAPTGALCLEPDGDGNLWLSGMFQTGVVKFDVAKETFRHFRCLPR